MVSLHTSLSLGHMKTNSHLGKPALLLVVMCCVLGSREGALGAGLWELVCVLLLPCWQRGCCWQWVCKQLGSAATEGHSAAAETAAFVAWRFMQTASSKLRARQDAGQHTPGLCGLSVVVLLVQERWFTVCLQPCLGQAPGWAAGCPSGTWMGVTACPRCDVSCLVPPHVVGERLLCPALVQAMQGLVGRSVAQAYSRHGAL